MKTVSIVIPALNEEGIVGKTVGSIPVKELNRMGLEVEVLVVDNASVDNTAEEAREAGARVIHESRRGYGNAYIRGFKEAKGDILVMGDADGTYPLDKVHEFITPLLHGKADFVMGDRLNGEISPGAMPSLHRYVGNPILTFTLNMLFKTSISDSHCGMRAFTRDALERMDLKTPGMEFASEMLIEAKRADLEMVEVPIEYRPRGGGNAKLHSFEDGWRHLRFMILYNPLPFLIIPGLLLFIFGLGLLALIAVQGPSSRFHSLILGGMLTLIGFQTVSTGLFMKIYAVTHGLTKAEGFIKKFLNYHYLEVELLLGAGLLLTGVLLGVRILFIWTSAGFGGLAEVESAVLSLVIAFLGIQVISFALSISVLLLNWRNGNGGNGL